jgi:hypothetical protein
MSQKDIKCLKCGARLRKVSVSVQGAKNRVISYQCPKCEYFEFEQESSRKVIDELRDNPLKIRQKIVKLSKDRLGIYFNTHVVRSLNLKKGEEISLSVPDKKHILLEISS